MARLIPGSTVALAMILCGICAVSCAPPGTNGGDGVTEHGDTNDGAVRASVERDADSRDLGARKKSEPNAVIAKAFSVPKGADKIVFVVVNGTCSAFAVKHDGRWEQAAPAEETRYDEMITREQLERDFRK